MEKELYHHGIEGQKWGKRHGPPYPLDRSESRAIKKQAKALAKQEKILRKRGLSSKAASKYAKQLTDEQLNDVIDRLKREETYKNLVKKPEKENNKPKIENPLKNKDNKQPNTDPNSFKNTTKSILSSGAKTLAAAGIKKLADDMFKDQKPPDVTWSRDSTGKWTVRGTTNDVNAIKKFFTMAWDVVETENKKSKSGYSKAEAEDIIKAYQEWQYNRASNETVLKLPASKK